MQAFIPEDEVGFFEHPDSDDEVCEGGRGLRLHTLENEEKGENGFAYAREKGKKFVCRRSSV